MTQRSLVSLALALCLAGTTACAHHGETISERQAFDPNSCHAGTFDVYFRPAQVKLSVQAKAQIEAVQRAISGCRIEQISVVGLPDATGDARTAQKVSQARANAILATLGSSGIPRDKLHALARGIDETAGRNDLLRRRGVIMVEASPSL